MTNFNNVSEADVTAGNNSSLASVSILGTGLVSTADDTFRNYASILAKWWDDLGAVNTVAGTANAVTVTTPTVYATLKTGMFICFIAGLTNTGAATLNLDAIGAKALRKAFGATDVALAAGDIVAGRTYAMMYRASANAAAGGWIILEPTSLASTARQRTNRFWNPSMDVSQQNGTTLGTTNGYFASDSLAAYFVSTAGAISFQQVSVTSLNGSTKQVQWKCTTANASPGATNLDTITGKIEGLDAQDLKWGTANAVQATLAFNFTGPAGTYNVHIQNRSANRHIAVPFTPTVANTEERITVVIPGDTSGTWTVDNDTLVTIDFVMLAGSNFVGGSASTWGASAFYASATQFNGRSVNTNTINITDVQFSPDPDNTGVAPAWVPVDFGNATRDCQRYVEIVSVIPCAGYDTVTAIGSIAFKCDKRSTGYTATLSSAGNLTGNGATPAPSGITLQAKGLSNSSIDFAATGLTAAASYSWRNGSLIILNRMT